MSAAMKGDSYQVIWLIRRLFRAMSQKSSEYIEEFGISVADRAVMEFLYPDKMLSVPEIAEKYQVSRQHVQTTVNALSELKLLTSRDNPRHKRSPLIMLSTKGRGLFDSVLKQDEQVIKALFAGISNNNVHVTRQTLQTLLDKISGD